MPSICVSPSVLAGMSGGIAYVFDAAKDFAKKVNMEMVELDVVKDPHEIASLRGMIEDHKHYTGSELAATILRSFNSFLPRFVRVMPLDYKAVLEAEAVRAAAAKKKSVAISKPKPIVKADKAAAVPLENGNHAAEPAKPTTNGKHEPAVVDLEDSMTDGVAAKKRVETLDKVRGFMKYKRLTEPYRNPRKRVQDWAEISTRLSEDECKVQTSRCMDCGVPFCQSDSGCPIGNIIPKWNDLVFKGQWRDALNRLLMTNNFPEFTGVSGLPPSLRFSNGLSSCDVACASPKRHPISKRSLTSLVNRLQSLSFRPSAASLDFPLVTPYRSRLPRSVRGCMRARHQRGAGRHQVDRVRHH